MNYLACAKIKHHSDQKLRVLHQSLVCLRNVAIRIKTSVECLRLELRGKSFRRTNSGCSTLRHQNRWYPPPEAFMKWRYDLLRWWSLRPLLPFRHEDPMYQDYGSTTHYSLEENTMKRIPGAIDGKFFSQDLNERMRPVVDMSYSRIIPFILLQKRYIKIGSNGNESFKIKAPPVKMIALLTWKVKDESPCWWLEECKHGDAASR